MAVAVPDAVVTADVVVDGVAVAGAVVDAVAVADAVLDADVVADVVLDNVVVSGDVMWALVRDVKAPGNFCQTRICVLVMECELTFANLHALEPRVVKIRLATTVFKPSATRSTTTEFAGFFVNATLITHKTGCCCAGRCCGC